jgi:hypothetical protein
VRGRKLARLRIYAVKDIRLGNLSDSNPEKHNVKRNIRHWPPYKTIIRLFFQLGSLSKVGVMRIAIVRRSPFMFMAQARPGQCTW